MSFRSQILASRAGNVYQLQSLAAGGVPQWHILQLDSRSELAFKMALRQTEPVDYSQFGTILASGTGEEPPMHVLWQLQADGLID